MTQKTNYTESSPEESQEDLEGQSTSQKKGKLSDLLEADALVLLVYWSDSPLIMVCPNGLGLPIPPTGGKLYSLVIPVSGYASSSVLQGEYILTVGQTKPSFFKWLFNRDDFFVTKTQLFPLIPTPEQTSAPHSLYMIKTHRDTSITVSTGVMVAGLIAQLPALILGSPPPIHFLIVSLLCLGYSTLRYFWK